MAHPTKKPWIKPEVRRFESSEELLAFYRSKSAAERQKLDELLGQAGSDQASSAPQPKLRRKSNG